jgi:CDP-glycerol glycerophosphotransferase (TagB/SpsB family)
LVFADHGLSNRSYSFDTKIKAFDLFFLFGEKERKIREALGQLQSNKHAVIGFPKYDLLKNLPQKQFFKNNNPCILYNPHWQNELSSFFAFGEKILDFFATSPNYNLIFAPHSLLLVRNKKLWFKLLKYRNHANILIDWGSESSNDMSYTKAADLYLGDISSQALEFVLIKERPCLFLDAHQLLQEKDQLISWQLGPVIATVDEFEHSIQNAISTHLEEYAAIQSKIVEAMIFKSEQSASNLAAAAISDLL